LVRNKRTGVNELMSRVKKVAISTFLSVIILAVATVSGFAQSPVTAEVDRTSLSTDESLVLTVRASADPASASAPTLPPLDGFRLDGTSSGRSISILNGSFALESVYQFHLTPTQAGDLIIGPVTLEINGQSYSTDPIVIHVTQGTGQPQPSLGTNPSFPGLPGFLNFPSLPDWLFSPPGSSPPSLPVSPAGSAPLLDPESLPPELTGQDLFVESAIGKLNPYQGEGLIHIFRFYQAVELFEQPEYQPPAFTGFWHEQVGEPQTFTIEAAGRTYRVTEIQTSLFPTVVGGVEIEPASLSIPASFFRDEQQLSSRPLQLDVMPLPPGSPAGFMGAVGQFNLTADVDKRAAEVNDTVTLSVTLSGAGNLETAPEPAWSEGPEWRAFDTKSSVDSWIENGQIHGAVRFERTLVPTVSGTLTLPPVQYVYFNPQSGAYETASTEPIAVEVAPDASASAPGATGGDAPGSTIGLTAPEDAGALRTNKTIASAAGGRKTPLPTHAGYWALWAIPVAFLAAQYVWQTARKRSLENPAARRSQAAARKGHRALRAAMKSPSGSAQVGLILKFYLEDKLDRPVAGLTEASLSALLREAGAGEDLAGRVVGCLRRSEMSRYAPEDPAGRGGEDLLREASRLIDELERNL
jgi:hypothetical protein